MGQAGPQGPARDAADINHSNMGFCVDVNDVYSGSVTYVSGVTTSSQTLTKRRICVPRLISMIRCTETSVDRPDDPMSARSRWTVQRSSCVFLVTADSLPELSVADTGSGFLGVPASSQRI